MTYEPKNGMTYRHSNVIDWMLRNPDKPLKEASEETGFTPQYLYMLRKSDMFRAEYERRRVELDMALHVDMLDKWKAVEEELLDKMIAKLKGPVTEKFLIAGLDSINKRLPQQPVVAFTQNNFLASPEAIRQARERAAELARGRGQAELEATPSNPRSPELAGKDTIDVEAELLA